MGEARALRRGRGSSTWLPSGRAAFAEQTEDTAQRADQHRRERAEGPRQELGFRSRESGRATSGQQARICRALRFQVSRVILECSLCYTIPTETKLRLCAMDLLRERKTVNMSWWSRPQPLQHSGCRR